MLPPRGDGLELLRKKVNLLLLLLRRAQCPKAEAWVEICSGQDCCRRPVAESDGKGRCLVFGAVEVRIWEQDRARACCT